MKRLPDRTPRARLQPRNAGMAAARLRQPCRPDRTQRALDDRADGPVGAGVTIEQSGAGRTPAGGGATARATPCALRAGHRSSTGRPARTHLAPPTAPHLHRVRGGCAPAAGESLAAPTGVATRYLCRLLRPAGLDRPAPLRSLPPDDRRRRPRQRHPEHPRDEVPEITTRTAPSDHDPGTDPLRRSPRRVSYCIPVGALLLDRAFASTHPSAGDTTPARRRPRRAAQGRS